MNRSVARSGHVEEALTAPAAQIPRDTDAAFEDLYRRNRDPVYAYVAGLVRDRAAAEDVTALAFERAYRRRCSFDPKRGSRRGWLFGIARNAALDELRRRRRLATLRSDPVDDTAFPPEQGAEAALRRAALRSAIASLEARERELVALKFFAELTNSEIAAVIGISETNAGTRIHRVVEKLRRACDEAA